MIPAAALLALACVQSFRDPAPPKVNELEPVEAPAASEWPGLTFHSAARSLSRSAVREDWPGFLGPRRDGTSRERPLALDFDANGPRLCWEMSRGEGYAAPAVAEGRLVFTHREGARVHVDCLDPESGRRFWRFTYPCDYRGRYIKNAGPRATPFIAEGRVYVHGVEGWLHCLELATGRVVWKRDTNADFDVEDDFFGISSSPLVEGTRLFQNIGAPGGPCVAAFDTRSGRLLWGAGGEWGPSCASPVLADVHGKRRLFVLAGGDSRPPVGGLVVCDPASGRIDFRHPFRSRTYESVCGASPLIAGDRVYLTAAYGTGSTALNLDPRGGYEERWSTRRLGIEFSNPLWYADALWLVDGVRDRVGALVRVDPDSGRELARSELTWDEEVVYRGETKTISASIGQGSLLALPQGVLCLGDNGHLLRLALGDDGARVLARAALFGANESWTPLVLWHGLLFVAQTGRERFGSEPSGARLLCYDLRGRG